MASINATTQKFCYNFITFIFMNMYENIRNKINIAEKLRVCTNNKANMSGVYYPREQSLVPN